MTGSKSKRFNPSALATAFLVGMPAIATASTASHTQAFPHPLGPAGLTADARYGESLAVFGLTAVAGAPDHNASRGALVTHYFKGDQFDVGTILSPASLAPGDRFGAAVALAGNYLVVGAPGDDTLGPDAGAIYLYEELVSGGSSSWVFLKKIYASLGKAGDRFGSALAASDYSIAVGAPNATGTITQQGKVFTVNAINQSWQNYSIQTIVSPTPQFQEHFGSVLAIEGNQLGVGSPQWDDNTAPATVDSGRVLLYSRSAPGNAWSFDRDFLPAVKFANTRMGASIDLNNGDVFVGAPGAKIGPFGSNGAVFHFGTIFGFWVTAQEIHTVGGDAGYESEVGRSIAVQGDRLYVATASGVVEFRFKNGAWSETEHLVAPFADIDPLKYEYLGHVISTNSLFALVGRPSFFAGDKGSVVPFWYFGGNEWVNGSGTVGTLGIPRLRSAGTYDGGFGMELRLVKAKPNAMSLLLVRVGDSTYVPFKGGMMKAFPFNLALTIPVNAFGQYTIPATMPVGAAGIEFALQVLIADPMAQGGVALSDGISICTAP